LYHPIGQKQVLFDLGSDEDARAQVRLGEDFAQNAFGDAVTAGVGSGVNDLAASVGCGAGRARG
jgi:hypothetical protein